MYSQAQIVQMSQTAARKAAAQRKSPMILWDADIEALKAGNKGRANTIPFIGTYVPKGWERVDLFDETFEPNQRGVISGIRAEGGRDEMSVEVGAYFVDSSGMGHTDEAALTMAEFAGRLKPGYGYAVISAGQFQVVVGCYRKMLDAGEDRARREFSQRRYDETHPAGTSS